MPSGQERQNYEGHDTPGALIAVVLFAAIIVLFKVYL